MKPKMWAYLIHLGRNKSFKKNFSVPHVGELDDEYPIYRDFVITDREVWRKVTDFLPQCGINTLLINVGEAVRYDSHPELAVEGSWTKEELRQELDRLRSIGLTPLPKCNFSGNHNGWLQDYSYMLGTDIHNKICVDIVEELIELFDTPEFFHLGLEEEDPVNQGGQPVIVMRAPPRKTKDANILFDACRKHGVRPWIWLDYKGVEEFGGEEAFRANIGKDVLISNFYYDGWIWDHPDVFERTPNMKLYKRLESWGYEQIPTVSTFEAGGCQNAKAVLKVIKKYMPDANISGYMTAPWCEVNDKRYYTLLNDAFVFGNAIKDIYGE